jgi:hypothetical protein
LSAFTGDTGVAKSGMEYELDDEDYKKLDDFQKGIWTMREEGKVISQGSNTPTFRNNSASFMIRTLTPIVRPKTNATYASVLSLLRTGNYTAKDYFEVTSIKADKWGEYYKN